MIRRLLAIFSTAAVLVSCAGGGSGSGNGDKREKQASQRRAFPAVQVPTVYSEDREAASEYAAEHFWDAFFAAGGATDPEHVLGVADSELEEALASWLTILEEVRSAASPDEPAPLRRAQGWVSGFFGKIEKAQQRDSSSRFYTRFTEMVSKYMYDPNSPYRDEDLYLPFAEAAAVSPCTPDNLRAAYNTEARACRTNAFGQKVPDIRFAFINGVKGTLYGVGAEYTMLFFSNPGCTACKEIMGEVGSRSYINSYISKKRLAIVNVYVDEEIDKWRDYVPNYPKNWINGYDYTFTLRHGGAWDLRAIPSLYLLDSQKRVILKDAPTERVLSYLDRI